jgi:hypothetical protein
MKPGRFYIAAGTYFFESELDAARTMEFFDKAFQLSDQCGNSNVQIGVLLNIAQLKWCIGDYGTAILHSSKAQRLCKGNLKLGAGCGN